MQATSKSSASKTDSSNAESGSVMEQIQALVRPPPSDEKSRSSGTSKRASNSLSSSSSAFATSAPSSQEQRRYGRTSNHDRCDSCGEGGDLICCDRCPAAFHLFCCEPPLDRDDVPSGEWLCKKCNPPDVRGNGSNRSTPFDELIRRAANENPVAFTLPLQFKSNAIVPGGRKRKNYEGTSSGNSFQRKNNKEKKTDDGSGDQVIRQHCSVCSRTISRSGNVGGGDVPTIQCDFCPLQYHLDCLDPPRTTMPNGSWMCPRHAELMHPDSASEFLSKREAVLDKMRAEFCQHETKIDFLEKVHRMRHYGRQVRHTKRTAVEIPSFVQEAYRNPVGPHASFPTPSFSALCEAAALARNPDHVLRSTRKFTYNPVASSAQEQQDEWLREVIYFQCDATRHMSVAPEIRWRSRRKVFLERKPEMDGLKPVENGLGSDNDEAGEMEVDSEKQSDGKVSPTVSVASDVFLPESCPIAAQDAVISDHGLYALPDLELLHPDMVQILAQQRLQQILTPKPKEPRVSNSAPIQAPITNSNLKSQDPGGFKKGEAILCPLGEGSPFAINRQATTVGLCAKCDITLRSTRKCTRQSDMHACIIHDKASDQFELLNYSEFGTIIDGVNYSIGTSKAKPKRLAPVSITSYDIRALGTGPRARRALAKVDSARRKWGTSKHAKAFLDILRKQSDKEDSSSKSSSPSGPTHTRRNAHDPEKTNSSQESIPIPPPTNHRVNQATQHGSRRQETAKMPPQPSSDEEKEEKTADVVCLCAAGGPALEQSGWIGAAALHHGSVIQFGCAAYVFSIARQPGHSDLLDAVLSVVGSST